MAQHACAGSSGTPAKRLAQRRGIALMLVMIALVVTTILVGAALTTRDNAPQIGENAASAAEATWSAESAANFAVGAIAQSDDLSALLGGDDSFSNTMTINGATVNVVVTNMSGDPPSDADREVIVRATATIGGVDKIVEKHVTRLIGGGEPTEAADPYLSEFAVFANDDLFIENGSRISVWSLSPEAGSSLAVAKLGVGYSNMGNLDIQGGAILSGAGLYCDSDASLAIETALSGRADAGEYRKIPLNVPTLPGGLPTAFSMLPSSWIDIHPSDGATVTVAAGGRYDDIWANHNATVVLDASVGPLYQFEDIGIASGAQLRIRGDVSICVTGTLALNGGYVVLEDDASSVTFYLAGDVNIDNQAKLGIAPIDVGTVAGAVTGYVNPQRVRLIALATTFGGCASPQWEIDNSSVIVGMVHNPLGRVRTRASSTIFGHVVGGEIRLEAGGGVRYCPMLDTHMGYTSPTCPFYDAQGDVIPELLSILDDVAATTTTADGFVNKFNMEYNSAKDDGDLDLLELPSAAGRTITETLKLGGMAIF